MKIVIDLIASACIIVVGSYIGAWLAWRFEGWDR